MKREKLLLKIIKFYQGFISPFLGKRCRFWPSCSEYSYLAIEKYGSIKGLFLTFWRIMKCHPFHTGGIDQP